MTASCQLDDADPVDLSLKSLVKFHSECMHSDNQEKFAARQRGTESHNSTPFSSMATTNPHFKAIVNAIQQNDMILLKR